MASETSSLEEEDTPIVVSVPGTGTGTTTGAAAADKRGKHRILAELKRLHQDSSFLQEELEELEKTDNVSTICKEVHGPANMSWDRWFEGPQDPACRCRIL